MRKIYALLTCTVALLTSLYSHSQDFSNKGRDFWLCFPSHVPSSNLANQYVYITSDQNSSGTISYNGQNTTWTVTANNVTTVPINRTFAYISPAESGTPVNKGIHVKVNDGQPNVVVYTEIYASARTEASLILPVNVLGRKYRAISYNQQNSMGTGADPMRSQFQIIAVEDNTAVQIQLWKNGTINGAPFTVNLPLAGDVYQYQETSNPSQDLTGTYIESVATSFAPCKRIAVFAGSSSVAINSGGCSGGSYDPLMQQCYPITTWGKNFGLIPIAYNPAGYQARVMASEDNTTVNYGGTTVVLNAGQIYPYEAMNVVPQNQPIFISADKPISATQYLLSQNCAGGNGDPEMVILNPIEQNIKNVTIFTSIHQSIATQILNVLIPTAGAASFKIGGVPVGGFQPMPSNPNYSYLQYTFPTLADASYTLTADSGFNAVLYGMGNVETYGYSAGTNVADLYTYMQVHNQYSTVNFPAGCQNQPFSLSIVLPYQPSQIEWNLTSIGYGTIMVGPTPAPIYDSTWTVNGKTLYRYPAPSNPYIVFGNGVFPIIITPTNTNADNCNGAQQLNFDLQIFPPPSASFTFSPSSGCLSDSVHFFGTLSNTGGRPVAAWYWNFGDATTGNTQDPVHLYPIPLTYLVKFTAMTDVGCKADTTTQYVVINQPPTALFSVAQPTCAGQSVTLIDNSNPNGPSPVNYWEISWGDGSPLQYFSSSPFPHTYANAGTFTVSMRVRTAAGCWSTTPYTQTITIFNKPVANFSFTGTCLPSGFIQFTDLSTTTSPSTITSWIWTFGDGTPVSTLQNPTHNYASSGPFNVLLTVTSSAGCSKDTMKIMNTVYAQPVANFTVDSLVSCVGNTIHVNSTSTAAGSTVQNYYWNFGDGSATQTLNHPDTAHTYTTPGTYIVKHWVQSAALCVSDTSYRTITVVPGPIASFTVSSPLCATQSVTLTSTSTSSAGSITNYAWTINGTASGGNNPVITFLPSTSGVYTIVLRVTTSNGCTNQVTQNLNVNTMPFANFTFGGACLPSGLTQFTDQTTPSGIISNWSWNFGDGSPASTLQNPTHNYASTGPFNVVLTVTSNNGCVDDTMKVMNVVYAQPTANFTMDSVTSCAGNSVHFTSTSVAPNSTVQTYYWNYGDGSPVQSFTNPISTASHLYTTAGTYQVKHWVTSAASCPSDTMTKTVTVVPLPTASFTVSSPLCATQNVTLTSTSTAGAGTINTYTWTVNGIPTGGNNQVISFVPTTSGAYTIVLRVTTSNGCTNQVTQNINVNTMPLANFTFGGACLPSGLTQFTDQTTPSGIISNWSWNFGDGSPASTLQNPAHNYASTGPFNVVLTVTSSNGCIDDTMKVMNVVYAQPTANFTMDSVTSCTGSTVHFTSTSAAPNSTVQTYYWNYGDGSPVQSFTNPVSTANHLYTTPGTYQVKHWVTSAASCPSDTMTKTVTVVPLPTASFSVSSPLCATQNVTLTSTSTPGFGTINSYSWTINGSPAGNTSSITFTPSTSGSYTIKLTVGTTNACSSQVTQTINVNTMPLANFSFTGACLPSGLTQFTDQTTPSGIISSWSWNFGDGSPISILQNPTHNYASTGPFNVVLTVTSSSGCIDDTMRVMNVVYAQPTANFNVDSVTSCAGNTVHFTDQSVAPNSSPQTYSWNFGDGSPVMSGTSPAQQNPSHLYTTPGTFQVKHWITSAAGCPSDTMTRTITVVPLPTASFTVSNPLCALQQISFTSTSTANFGSITSLSWTVNGVPAGTGTTMSFTPSAGGAYSIALSVITSNNCTSQTTQTINVNAHPVANFSFNGACLPSGFTQFNDQSTVNGGTINGWSWDFGDGSAVITGQQNPSHNYASTGPFNVHLTVTSSSGCTADTIKAMNTVYAQPQAAFAFPAEVCNGSVANFTDQSTAPNNTVASWNWNFGDGGTSTQQNPTHTYLAPGTYTVTLNIVSAAGCTSTTATHNVIVNPLPTANFTISAINCLNQSISFTDASIPNAGSIVSWSWNFGDGGTSTTQNPTHTYTSAGTFNATLQVTTNKGCVSSMFTLPLTVHALPSVNFSMPVSCVNDVPIFTDNSTVSSGTITGWSWNFGDGGTSTVQNPSHSYSASGTYNVSLTATSNFGCTGSATKPFTIAGMVNTNFSIQGGGTSFCSGSTLNLTDNSTVSPGAVLRIEIYWDYTNNPMMKTTDNSPTTGAVYSHTYPEFGSPASQNVTIRYVAYSGQNCSQFVDRVITLKATPTVYFNSVNGICADVPAFQITQAGISNGLPGTGVFSGPGVSSTGMFNPASAGSGPKTIRYMYTASNGCSNYKDQVIDVYPVPAADAGPDKVMIEGGQVVLTPNTNYGYPVNYQWTPATYLDNANTSKPKASPPFDFTYTLTVTSDKGCSTTDQVFVKILKNPVIPNIFSPNGDGVHDQWIIPYLNTYPGCTVDIFNRYGQLVFHSVGYNTPWDGTINGKQAPVGTYYYIVDPKNGRKKMSGYVDIIR